MSVALREALDRLELSDFFEVFLANDIDAETLGDLTESDLHDMGLSIGQRKRALRGLGRLARRAPPAPPAPRATAERRQLTTLFCDLVGSTQLATVLDPEDLRDVIEAFRTLCVDVMAAHAGHVAYSQGDGLMVYFGYPHAREDDPERAMRAAIEVGDRLAGLASPTRQPLRARIGVATGIVVVGEPDDGSAGGEIVVGESINLAARLQQAAAPGEAVVSETTRRLAGGLFEYEARGVVEFKGFPEPVPVFRVVRETGLGSRFEARAATGLGPIVGRDPELARLRRVWREARAGGSRLAVVAGEAGIGKSRLARAVIDAVRTEGAHVVRWDCAAHLANRALHPVARELAAAAGLSRGMSPADRAEAVARFVARTPGLDPADAPALAGLLGAATPETGEADPATRARRLIDALARRIGGLCAAAPTLVLLEDAHWADGVTLDLVGTLGQRFADAALMIVVTHRPEFEPPWSDSARRVGIALEAIDIEAGGRLVDMVMRERALPAALVRSILEKAGGVPLFVEELTKAVLDAIEGERAADMLTGLSVPASLHDSLMARLDRLGDAKLVAQLGAVIGREFTADMVRVIAPERHDVPGGLRRLCESGLAYARGEGAERVVVFHHALIQDTAYDSLLKKRRREVHRAIAEAMLAGDPAFAGVEPETIARHCTLADMPEPAADHWLAAGLHALDRAANAAAVSYLRRGLDEGAKLPQTERRSRRGLAMQQALSGASMAVFGWASDEVERACASARELALELGDGQSLFGAEWGLWSTQFLRGEQEAAIAIARGVDAMAASAGSPFALTLADHAVGYTLFWRGELAAALDRATSAIARFDPAVERQIIIALQLASTVNFHSYRAPVLWMQGAEAEAHRGFDTAIAFAESFGHAPTLAYALGQAGFTLVMRRDWSRLAQVSARMRRICIEGELLMWETVAEMHGALAEGGLGDPEHGLEAFEATRARFLATRTKITDPIHQVAAAELMLRIGEPRRAVDRLDTVIADAERRAERVFISELYRVRGEARRALGDRDGARADVEAALRIAREQRAPTLAGFADASLSRLTDAVGRTVRRRS